LLLLGLSLSPGLKASAELRCSARETLVIIAWDPLAAEFAGASFRLERDGVLIARLGSTENRFTDEVRSGGSYRYAVYAEPVRGGELLVGECRIGAMGRGGNETIENGDANGDFDRDVSDAVHFLLWLFLGGPAPAAASCPAAFDCGGEVIQLENGDANGDRRRDVSDAVYLLRWLFLGGPAPDPLCFCRSIQPCGIGCREPYSCVPSGPTTSVCTDELSSCEEVAALYESLVEGFGKACDPAEGCRLLWGYCAIGIGGCYHAVSAAIRQHDIDALAARFQELGCSGPVCRCAPPPAGAGCAGNRCEPEN
jgi:hypothetical protein